MKRERTLGRDLLGAALLSVQGSVLVGMLVLSFAAGAWLAATRGRQAKDRAVPPFRLPQRVRS